MILKGSKTLVFLSYFEELDPLCEMPGYLVLLMTGNIRQAVCAEV